MGEVLSAGGAAEKARWASPANLFSWGGWGLWAHPSLLLPPSEWPQGPLRLRRRVRKRARKRRKRKKKKENDKKNGWEDKARRKGKQRGRCLLGAQLSPWGYPQLENPGGMKPVLLPQWVTDSTSRSGRGLGIQPSPCSRVLKARAALPSGPGYSSKGRCQRAVPEP